MESAPTYKLDGDIRIFMGLTVTEIIIVITVLVLLYVFLPHIVMLLVGTAAGRLCVTGVRLVQRFLPTGAISHIRAWLSQADAYTPMADPRPRPLYISEV